MYTAITWAYKWLKNNGVFFRTTLLIGLMTKVNEFSSNDQFTPGLSRVCFVSVDWP